ncbi:unnamed protein product [Rotaria socialis]|uniref:Uncharacterized protein n=1 Tax=Rotaria socialis TaxID=392032 RepID=A0A818APY4_9BILA|nr:unnamed protein product [Rotaria socialis]CAF3396401.1 unnamed protein product [Rotaria socialis]CAF3406922.1 unnamed protein product [Rotaria socialis]CAF3417849.1 unnamed protein product [Rotaria socialis]CAF4115583.1 unnamed protein product [Rotaria socialis]
MHHYIVIFIGIFFVNFTHSSYTTKHFSKLYHPGYSTVGNLNVPLEYDCALRAFIIEMARYIAPPSSQTYWTELSQSAFQMNQCNNVSIAKNTWKNRTKSFKIAPEIQRTTCYHRIFVHDFQGNDMYDGTFERPKKTIQAALSFTRTLRATLGSDKILCITIRGGTYYLGTNATTTSSQIGAIALTANDSNLVIENYQDERVILSGGTLLQLQWSTHAKTAAGGTIMKAHIPPFVNLNQFNELYIDDRRAIVAKYPNGDPSTQGLYAKDPGFSYGAKSWVSPIVNPSVNIHVDKPYRNGTVFTNYQLGIGGGASVFNPPRNFWSTASPTAGRNYVVPRGFTVKNGALPHISNWSKPTTGFVHAFHPGYWGSWVFEIASVNSTKNTIMFGRGGFQEARGSHSGGAFYVSNIFEELDAPNEWFLDKDTRTLYFMPNETMPQVFVASQIPCLISISGSDDKNSASNILIQGLIFSQTSNTYMQDYMVPSGGDWALHRGGTMYLTNTKNITITRNLFTQLGSNGIALIDYNDATSIALNEFVWLADSAIILVGSTNGIDGFSVISQPANTLIQSNLIHETGIYIKQSSPVLISVSRSISVIGNLMFNMPRAAINVNDGFYGNHTLSWNVIFNTVRETSDHGPINSWDRQPFLTDAVQTGLPSLWQHKSHIHHNTIFNNYRCVWPIDHDDGSCFYEDSYNFLVYGGKKNYLGHSKTDHHEIYVFPDANQSDFINSTCLRDTAAQRGSSGWNEVWINNTCVLFKSSVPYHIQGCDTSDLFVPLLMSNQIYVPSGTQVAFVCKVNGTTKKLTLKQWNSYGLDLGTTINTTPDVQDIIEWGREMLQRAE